VIRVAVLGLGEAGSMYASDLAAAGAVVTGYDPFRRAPDIDQRRSAGDAVQDADVVLSLVGARSAVSAAREALAHAPRSCVYADLNTAAPERKAEVAALAGAQGIPMTDVAVLAPVLRDRLHTPLLASGPAAERFVRVVAPLGMAATSLAGEPGDAARLKLLRSVFMKGLAALVIETLQAGRDAGAERWVREQIASELGPEGDAVIEQLVTGTYRHALRREHEVRDALAALEVAGQPADMTRATLAWFERIVREADRR
jgi:3-hydroxyisobutyrate dehydrogenase-like beta-hydroxyacid dehydrogenase